MTITFTNAVVEDDGYGVEVNGRSLEAIISTALGTRLGDKGGYSSGLPKFKANSCDVTVTITPHPTECLICTGKNTQALLDYMNSKTSTDPNVVALYTKMDKLCDGLSDEVVLKVTHGEHRVKRSWNKNFEYVFDVGIPKINPNYIGTYDTNLHEEMHFLDMLITVKDNKDKLPSKMFSQSYKPLVEAFDKATPVIGDKAKKLFEDFAKECDIIYKKQQETFNTQHEKIKEQYRSGAIDWKKYNSLFKKLQKEVNEEADNKRRALFGGGVSGLQNIYDAVSKGTFRDTGQVT